MSGPNGIATLNRHELDAQAEAPTRHFALIFYSIAEMAANTTRDLRRHGILGLHHPAGRCLVSQQSRPHSHSALPSPLASSAPTAHTGRACRRTAGSHGLSPIVLQPGNSRLEFAFTPIQLRSQAGLRFRYIYWTIST